MLEAASTASATEVNPAVACARSRDVMPPASVTQSVTSYVQPRTARSGRGREDLLILQQRPAFALSAQKPQSKVGQVSPGGRIPHTTSTGKNPSRVRPTSIIQAVKHQAVQLRKNLWLGERKSTGPRASGYVGMAPQNRRGCSERAHERGRPHTGRPTRPAMAEFCAPVLCAWPCRVVRPLGHGQKVGRSATAGRRGSR